MAWSLLQTKTSSKTAGAGTTSTASMSTTTTGGLVVVVTCTDSGVNSVSGISCAGMSFTKIDDSLVSGGTYAVSMWYAYNITTQTTPTLTVTYVAGCVGGAIIREYSGATTSDPLDKHAAPGTGNNAAPTSGATATQTGSNDLVIGGAGTGDSGNTYTAGAGYGNATTLKIGTTVDLGMEDKQLSGSTAAQTAVFSITNISVWACEVATFKMLDVAMPVAWLKA